MRGNFKNKFLRMLICHECQVAQWSLGNIVSKLGKYKWSPVNSYVLLSNLQGTFLRSWPRELIHQQSRTSTCAGISDDMDLTNEGSPNKAHNIAWRTSVCCNDSNFHQSVTRHVERPLSKDVICALFQVDYGFYSRSFIYRDDSLIWWP